MGNYPRSVGNPSAHMLTDRQLRIAAYIVGEEIARRQRFGNAVPDAFRSVHSALVREVCRDRDSFACENTHGAARLTATELAQRLGVSTRTVQRRAAAQNIPMTAGRYLFTTQHNSMTYDEDMEALRSRLFGPSNDDTDSDEPDTDGKNVVPKEGRNPPCINSGDAAVAEWVAQIMQPQPPPN